MDPFKEVLADAEDQLNRVQRLLFEYHEKQSHEKLQDIELLMQELTETLHDLSQSIATAQQNPGVFGLEQHEINARIQQVGHINSQVSQVQEQLETVRHETELGMNRAPNPQQQEVEEDPVQELTAEERQQMAQQQIQEQDDVLDSVFHTVNALREQANVMSQELEDQAVILDDFEQQTDNAGDRLRQGLKRVDYVLKHNRETLSSCCITLLIIALVILLVMVIII